MNPNQAFRRVSPWCVAVREWLRIDVLDREFPDATDYSDGNWLMVEIRVRNEVCHAGWSGACLRSDELKRFGELLPALHNGVVGEVRLRPLEKSWDMTLTRLDDLGHFTMTITLDTLHLTRDGVESVHEFQFIIDQTDVHQIESGIRYVLREFPVKDSP